MSKDLQGCRDNGLVWAGEALTPTVCHRMAWRDGIITELDLGDPVERMEGFGFGLLPGLVNAHTHAGDCFLADAAVDATLEETFFRPDGLKYRALAETDPGTHVEHMTDFLRGMAASGTVAHIDFREQGVDGAQRLREASHRSGVASVILSQLDRIPFTPGQLASNQEPLPSEALEEFTEMLKVADGVSESTMNDFTDAAWQQVRDITTSAGKARAIHCLENDGYRSLSLERTGRGDVERALDLLHPDLIVHMTVANEEEIQRLAASGIPVVINVRANMALGLPAPPVFQMMRAGVTLLVGTDNGILNGPDLFRELDAVYRLACSQAGPEQKPAPADILKMATSNFRKTRWGDRFPGELSVGGPATFVEVDLSGPHLQTSRHPTASLITRMTLRDLRHTVLEGRVLYAAD